MKGFRVWGLAFRVEGLGCRVGVDGAPLLVYGERSVFEKTS